MDESIYSLDSSDKSITAIPPTKRDKKEGYKSKKSTSDMTTIIGKSDMVTEATMQKTKTLRDVKSISIASNPYYQPFNPQKKEIINEFHKQPSVEKHPLDLSVNIIRDNLAPALLYDLPVDTHRLSGVQSMDTSEEGLMAFRLKKMSLLKGDTYGQS